ncbi:TIGR04222 domain-containing membrane protein [Erythrobacter sp. NE805]|uniref:TIGR04222 domain-containing membrane protein n=1 Tax=Erythrobacter sp. NE805 TaxID=3389875 RepID=UPI00396B0C22
MQLFSSWTGSDFLILYTVLLAAGCAGAWVIPQRLRARGRAGDAPDVESAALLAGGRTRLAEAVLTDLYVRGGIVAASDGRLVVARHDIAASPAGQALLALDPPLTLRAAGRALGVHAERLAARLRRSGLMMWPDVHWRLRWLSLAPFAALLVLGLYRQRAGTAEGEPTGPLVVLLGVTLGLAVIRFAVSDPRTRAGIDAVRRLRARTGRGAGAIRADTAAMAVALHGTSVLAGTRWEPLHALRLAAADNGGSGADGGSGDWGDASCDSGGGDGGSCGD